MSLRLVSKTPRIPLAYRDETDFNWHMRQALMDQGFRTLHIREANETGVADLVVYESLANVAQPHEYMNYQIIRAWLELKMEWDPRFGNVRTGQKEFMRDHWRIGKNALFVFRDLPNMVLRVRQGDLKGREIQVTDDPYGVRWQEVFARFKRR